MRRYEFNLKDINNVKIYSKASKDGYYTDYTRNFNSQGEPLLTFKRTYHAEPKSYNGKTKVMCENCRNMVSVENEKYNSGNYVFSCNRCGNNITNLNEKLVKDEILKYMTKEKFNIVDIYINGIHIV